MSTKIFVNLPVKDLNRSVDFFSKLNYKINPQFTDDKAGCVVIGEDNYVMLVTENFFKTFTQKAIADAKRSTEVIVSLSAESRHQVDEMIEKAIECGAREYGKTQDYGWMYQRGYQDLDGHLWEIIYMDMNAARQRQA